MITVCHVSQNCCRIYSRIKKHAHRQVVQVCTININFRTKLICVIVRRIIFLLVKSKRGHAEQ